MWRSLYLRLLVLCGALVFGAASQAATLHVLFIGNSYTYTNDMPHLLMQLAARNGRRLNAEAITIGGASLEELWNKGDAQRAIEAQRWDYVVLQDYSLQALERPETLRRFIRLFDERIRASGARTVLYLTWTRASAPQRQAAIDAVYRNVAEELGATVAPVGPAWLFARQTAPGLPLYQDDGSHPTLPGSYLAADVFYRVLLGTLPSVAKVPAGLSAEEHKALLRATASAVQDEAATQSGHAAKPAARKTPAGALKAVR
jgi:hypothetical protein